VLKRGRCLTPAVPPLPPTPQVGCYKEIFRVLKPGACFAGYEWCATDMYDPNNAEHRAVGGFLGGFGGVSGAVEGAGWCATDVCSQSQAV
jgi:hypothetical protein